MTVWLWLYVISRMAICIAAGEIALRYGSWYWLLVFRAKEKIDARAIILIVVIWSFSRFVIEARWLSLLMDPNRAANFVAIDGNDPISAMGRFGVLAALCFATIVVTRVVYRNSKERALLEMAIRIFLFGSGLACGWIVALVYYFHA